MTASSIYHVSGSARLYFVLGLCGSGKSHVLDELRRAVPDLRTFDEGVFHDVRLLQDVRSELRRGGRCAIADCRLLTEGERRDALGTLSNDISPEEVRWICIEKDIDTANNNCRKRTNKSDPEGHVNLNVSWVHHYTYPAGAVIVPSFRLP